MLTQGNYIKARTNNAIINTWNNHRKLILDSNISGRLNEPNFAAFSICPPPLPSFITLESTWMECPLQSSLSLTYMSPLQNKCAITKGDKVIKFWITSLYFLLMANTALL